jgi:N-acetylmuramoyl-L-alanine amidase
MVVPGGQPRFYMTYGHVDEPELYAPLLPELRRLGITFQPQGDKYAVYFKGRKVAEWEIVRSREDVPETAEDPYVLVMGGNVFVPVRALAQRFSLDVKLQKKDNLIALVPMPVKPAKPGKSPSGVAQLPPAQVPVTLQGVEIRQVGGSVQVRVRSSAPVTPKWLTVRLPLPIRIALDFPNSRWADGLQLPAPAGDVQNLRIGMPDPKTARLVFEVPSAQVKVTNVSVGADSVEASIGQGTEAKLANLDPEVRKILDALAKRSQGTRLASVPGNRGSLDDPLTIDPTELPVIPVDPPKQTIERLPPLSVNPAVSLVGKTICVDAGHGGHSSGAKGLDNLEKDLCLQMCLSLQRELEQRGARVIMTRDTDAFVSLEGRCLIANNANADLFISIHLNSTPTRNSASGTETYWHTPQSQRLARALHRRVVVSFKGEDRGIRNRGFYVIRNTDMPSVLLEIGFINNKSDEAILAQGVFQNRLAESLTLGVLDFFGKDLQNRQGE